MEKPALLTVLADTPANPDKQNKDMNQRFLHPDPELNAQILAAPPELQHYILALQAKVAELQAKVAELQAKVAEMQVQQITPQDGLPPASKKRAKKRGIHPGDMVVLRKMVFGERPPQEAAKPEGEDLS